MRPTPRKLGASPEWCVFVCEGASSGGKVKATDNTTKVLELPHDNKSYARSCRPSDYYLQYMTK